MTRRERDRLRDIKEAITAIRELEIVDHDLPPLEQAIDRLL
jgi:hypothetical protein